MPNKSPINPLGMEDALRLYGEISPFIEYPDDETLTATFVREIIDQMREKDVDAYLRCIGIMTGKTDEEMIQMQALDLLELFIDGLRENQLLSLCQFGKGLKYV